MCVASAGTLSACGRYVIYLSHQRPSTPHVLVCRVASCYTTTSTLCVFALACDPNHQYSSASCLGREGPTHHCVDDFEERNDNRSTHHASTTNCPRALTSARSIGRQRWAARISCRLRSVHRLDVCHSEAAVAGRSFRCRGHQGHQQVRNRGYDACGWQD